MNIFEELFELEIKKRLLRNHKEDLNLEKSK